MFLPDCCCCHPQMPTKYGTLLQLQGSSSGRSNQSRCFPLPMSDTALERCLKTYINLSYIIVIFFMYITWNVYLYADFKMYNNIYQYHKFDVAIPHNCHTGQPPALVEQFSCKEYSCLKREVFLLNKIYILKHLYMKPVWIIHTIYLLLYYFKYNYIHTYVCMGWYSIWCTYLHIYFYIIYFIVWTVK